MTATLLKRSLSSKLGWVSRTLNECEDLVKLTPIPHDDLKVQVELLKERWVKYEVTFSKLEDCLIENELSDERDIFINSPHLHYTFTCET